jgi:ubiquinone/menaquinone biosynthesis C-methylase UbiE
MWTDPYISQQLLELHINPDHDIASRNKATISETVNWILSQTNQPGMKILDLGCGPGLYANQLALKGHFVTGIDFSANSIQYARQQAKEKKQNIEYRNMNYLNLDYENEFDLAILIYLDFCVLLPEERFKILRNIHRALKPGGMFVCDVVNEKNMERKILSPFWDIQHSGFWKPTPYMVLSKGYHYPEAKVFANHHVVIGNDDTVDTYIFWNHYYAKRDLVSVFESVGFSNICNHENVLPNRSDYWGGENVTFYVSHKE